VLARRWSLVAVAAVTVSAGSLVAVQQASAAAVPVRINAGGPAWTDPDGLRYAADFGFVGGTPYTGTGQVKGTAKDELYRTLR